MTTGIILPEFDPFLISFGGFGIRWYALAYIFGLVGGYWILRREAQRAGPIDLAGIESLLNHVLIVKVLRFPPLDGVLSSFAELALSNISDCSISNDPATDPLPMITFLATVLIRTSPVLL